MHGKAEKVAEAIANGQVGACASALGQLVASKSSSAADSYASVFCSAAEKGDVTATQNSLVAAVVGLHAAFKAGFYAETSSACASFTAAIAAATGCGPLISKVLNAFLSFILTLLSAADGGSDIITISS